MVLCGLLVAGIAFGAALATAGGIDSTRGISR